LLGSIRDQATRDRITAAFKMLSKESRISGEAIHKQAAPIRKRFIRHHLALWRRPQEQQRHPGG